MKKTIPAFCLLWALLAFSPLLLTAQMPPNQDIADYIRRAPFAMPQVPLPVIPAKTFNLKDFGGVGDGKTLNTEAFARLISACAKAGGGRAIVPAGTWLTGPIELKSHVDLHLEKDALVQFTPDRSQFPLMRMGDSKTVLVTSPLWAYQASNFSLSGEGIFDGAGESWRPVKKSKVSAKLWEELSGRGVVSADGKIWWPSAEAMNGDAYLKSLQGKAGITDQDYLPARDFLRPHMTYFVQCSNVLLQGITLRNSPKFVFYPSRCSNLTLNGITVLNDWWAQNGDGIDISACRNVVVYNCRVSVGDDGICMKSSRGAAPNADSALLKNILVARCTVNRAHGGFVIGSNTDGGMENIYVTDCLFDGSDIGIRVKSNPGRGGLIRKLYIDGIRMKNIIKEAIHFTTVYEDVPAGKEPGVKSDPVAGKIPQFRDILIRNVVCESATRAIGLEGTELAPITDLLLENITLKAGIGLRGEHAHRIRMEKVQIQAAEPLFKLSNSSEITLNGQPLP